MDRITRRAFLLTYAQENGAEIDWERGVPFERQQPSGGLPSS